MSRIIFFCVFFLFSCSPGGKTIIYKLGNTSVTRLNTDGAILLGYGNVPKNDYEAFDFKITYKGSDAYVDAFLVFRDSGKVELVDFGGGYYSKMRDNELFYMINYENPRLIQMIDSFEFKYKNVYRISSSIDFERKTNKFKNSEVVVIY